MTELSSSILKMSSEGVMQYVPFLSFVDPSFWHTLARVKLDVDRLEETREIAGSYNYSEYLPAMLEVNGTSFNRVTQTSPQYEKISGTLICKNTIESFKQVDKAELLNQTGEKLWELIKKKEWISSPNQLLRFTVLAFADLKKYHYYYWFAFPAPSQPIVHMVETKPLSDLFTESQIRDLNEGFKLLDEPQKSFFAFTLQEEKINVLTLSNLLDANVEEKLKQDGTYIAFLDPSNGPNPGWPLRILIAAFIELCPYLMGRNVNVVGVRCKKNGSMESSVYFKIHIPEKVHTDKMENPGWVGWERNEKGKLLPMSVNMAASMDPVKLAEDSAYLNLKLMKWRLVPDINLEIVRDTKCLLFGAGTLGCHVARNLLAWGVRNITFLDNGKVSCSNPVRQVLYKHSDCLGGGLKKAVAAAANMKDILPSVNSSGIVCHIPMPGHPVGDSMRKETEESIETITRAILEHDVIFLLLDSREARWLPTLLAAHFNKLCINAALGFDSYLVMRHGTASAGDTSQPSHTAEYIPGSELGCYFCSDVTAPGNSAKDRTLDQQCTVTRPGVAAIAGALAVEVCVALLQHRLGKDAPAAYNLSKSIEHGLNPETEGVLGAIPHTVRGFLWSHHTVTPTSVKFRQCVACSDRALSEYRSKGAEFLFDVFDNASHLESVTGLTELHLAAELVDVMAMSDEEDDLTE